MENNDDSNPIIKLREWMVLNDLLAKIPGKLQRGIFYSDVNLTCIDVLTDFIALGSDVGVVFWYNRINGNMVKLRCEQSTAITCIKVISSVEYMIAAGMQSGEVNVFQIQKEHPPELNIIAPITKAKPIERYTIGDRNRSTITALEWSKNGMKLFSGDGQGLVVMTEFDFMAHISKSCGIFNETYAIVQICFLHPWLLVSSMYRSIICEQDMSDMMATSPTVSWKISQIGKKDRKVLSKFGAVFTGPDRRAPVIICSRPSYRFWSANTDGDVSRTFLLKDAVLKESIEVPLLNPGPSRLITTISDANSNFGPCYNYKDAYILTHNEHTIFIINLEKLKVEAKVQRLRHIHCLVICDWEIFVLEGGRSLVRLSILPERIRDGSVVYNTNYVSGCSSGNIQSAYVVKPLLEFEAEEGAITRADECFELPPIEHLVLETELNITNGMNSKENKLLLEHSLKTEVFERINQLQYDNAILYKTGLWSKKKKSNQKRNEGIVEVGQQAVQLQTPDASVPKSASMKVTSDNGSNGVVPKKAAPELSEPTSMNPHESIAPFFAENTYICDTDDGGKDALNSANIRGNGSTVLRQDDVLKILDPPSNSVATESRPIPLPDSCYKTNYTAIDNELQSSIPIRSTLDDDQMSRASTSERVSKPSITSASSLNPMHLSMPAKIMTDDEYKNLMHHMHSSNLWNAQIELKNGDGRDHRNRDRWSESDSSNDTSEWELL